MIESMVVERSVEDRAALHAALGEPVRLAIADALAIGDASPGELARVMGIPSNLLAHHLGVMEAAGVVRRSRSEADRRRSYVQLTAAAFPHVTARVEPAPARVVFVCSRNSARSQLAQALWASRARLPVVSAGTRPASRIHPRTVAVAQRHGLELRSARPVHLTDVVLPEDFLVAVCDQAYEELGRAARLHWSVPDPVDRDDEPAFDEAFDNLDERVGRLVTALVQQPENSIGDEITT
jgi:ArsR family transcriptional regulator, arsenate/arsenite/antimonite-responsive transcriptional repressor / arsenate reductase (thioredoxin)